MRRQEAPDQALRRRQRPEEQPEATEPEGAPAAAAKARGSPGCAGAMPMPPGGAGGRRRCSTRATPPTAARRTSACGASRRWRRRRCVLRRFPNCMGANHRTHQAAPKRRRPCAAQQPCRDHSLIRGKQEPQRASQKLDRIAFDHRVGQ